MAWMYPIRSILLGRSLGRYIELTNEATIICKPYTSSVILPLVKQKTFTVREVISILQQLNNERIKNPTSFKNIENDVNFQKICDMIGKKHAQLNYHSLLHCLRNLLFLKINPNSHVIQSLEIQVLWKVGKMDLKSLILLLDFQKQFQLTEIQQKVLRETISVIETKWTEISNPADILNLLAQKEHLSKNFISKVEERAIDIVEKLNYVELSKLFTGLAKLRHRPVPLLRTMSFHLVKQQEKMDCKHMANIVCAINTLNFPDTLLLHRISSDLVTEIPSIEKPTIIAALLTSFGKLKWKHIDLLESFTDWVLTHSESCREQELVAYLLTLAAVNYLPHKFNEIKQLLTRKLNQNSVDPVIWLDIVWSLVILGQASSHYLSSVLNPQFYSSLQNYKIEQLNIAKLKLLNINTAAKEFYEDYSGPFLANEEEFKEVQVPRSKELQNLNVDVCEALSNFLPKGKFLSTNKVIQAGIFIDAEFIVDKVLKPLSLQDYSTEFGSKQSNLPLPEGAYRFALLIWGFKELNLNSCDPTGINAFAAHLIAKLGYKVIQVNHLEFTGLNTTLKKVQFLQQKITEAIK